MKLKLFLIAASAMALASCSSDEVVKNNEDANAIQFSVVANNASRAADYYCNSVKPADFVVSASVGGKMYFDQEIFKTADNGASYQIFGDLRYWPAAEITFVAAKNCDGDAFTFNAETGSTFTMTVPEAASEQKDFIFGVTKATRDGQNYSGGKAKINFRHALSQIVFQAKNTNENIFVEIEQIKVCNLANSATYTIPATAGNYVVTDDAYIDHTQTSTTDPVDATVYQEGGRGTWSAWSAATSNFDTGKFTVAKVPGTGTLVNLTNDRFGGTGDHVANASHTHSLLLIPQAVTKWTNGGAVASADGAYFLISCKIRNVAKGDGLEDAGDVYLWGSAGAYDEIAVPVEAITWVQGKKYIYTLNFTDNGHGGFDPDNGDEVLIPIEFTVSVDDFAEDTTTPGQEIAID